MAAARLSSAREPNVALSTSLLFILAIAIAMAGLAFALPRFRARRDGSAAERGRSPAAPTGLVLGAALFGTGVMAIGFLFYFGDRREPDADAIASGATPPPFVRAELVRHLQRSPRDGRGWVLLARMDFEADRFADAAVAYERALATDTKVARDPTIWCEYADALGMTQGGSLAGKPRELVMSALALNPTHPKSLEMAGSAAIEAGEYASAVHYWRQLLPQLAERSRERFELAAAIARAEEHVTATGAQAGTAGVAR